MGNIREFTFFLKSETGQIDLDRRYSWVKCNNDFKGYYVADYSAQLLQAFDQVLTSGTDVIIVYDWYYSIILQKWLKSPKLIIFF